MKIMIFFTNKEVAICYLLLLVVTVSWNLGTPTSTLAFCSMRRRTTAATTTETDCISSSWYHRQQQEDHRVNSPNKQHHKRTSHLFGVFDEMGGSSSSKSSSSPYELGTSSSSSSDQDATFDIFLAELVFSTNDPRIDIMNQYEVASNPEFLSWLNQKISNSQDPDERIGLRDLYEMIVDIVTRVQVNKVAAERQGTTEQDGAIDTIVDTEETDIEIAESSSRQTMSTADILRKATLIQTAASSDNVSKTKQEKKSFLEEEVTPEILLSYDSLLKKVMPPYPAGDTYETIIDKYYEQFDVQFVKVLGERSNKNNDVDAQALLEALSIAQKKRMEMAAELLKKVLSLGDPQRMEGLIVKLAREGQIGEAFLLLLEANANQALAAGATGPAQVMQRLQKRAIEEKDKQSASKEIRLLRQLLRTDDPNIREKLLEEAFTPKQALLVPGTLVNAQKAIDGEQQDIQKALPEIPPPDFINACKAVLLNFGNLGSYDENRGDLATRIKKLAAEAEVVATRIFGQGMTLREQQDRAWKEQTTSIWDLEKMEMVAEQQGEKAPWSNPNSDDFLLPGFDTDGRMQIGGR